MSEKLRKVIIIVLFLAVVVALAYAIYYFFFKAPAPTELPGAYVPETLAPGQLPTISEGNVNRIIPTNINAGLPTISRIPEGAEISPVARGGYTQVNNIIETKVTTPAITADGGFNYYNASEGRFYRRNSDGSVSQLSSQRFYSVENITWSPDANQAILEYPDGANILYNFQTDKQYTLPKEFQDFDFAKSNQQIAAEVIGPREENNWIVTANPDGTNAQFIERLGNQSDNVDINWSPNNQVVALFRKNISDANQEIIFIGRHQENFRSLTTYGRGFEGSWTPKGDRLLYSVFKVDNNFRPTLWTVNASGNNIGLNNTDLGLETWSYKCTVATDNITAYCGVPDGLPQGSGIYPALAKDSQDSFYRVNLETGQRTLLAQPVGNQSGYFAERVFLSPDEKVLYFQDARTGGLYSINLE